MWEELRNVLNAKKDGLMEKREENAEDANQVRNLTKIESHARNAMKVSSLVSTEEVSATFALNISTQLKTKTLAFPMTS